VDTKHFDKLSKIVCRRKRIGLCQPKEGPDPAGYHLLLLSHGCTLTQDSCPARVSGLAGIHSPWRRVDGDIILGAYRILAQQSDTSRTHDSRSRKVGRPVYSPPRMVVLASDSWNDLRWKVGHSTGEFGVFLERSGRSWQCSY
jgi:hypothetical protein